PGIGFGLERIGLAALRLPVLFTLAIVAVSAFAGWNLRYLQFDGDITAVLPEDSQGYRDYYGQKETFRDFSRDITVIVQSDRLMTAEGLEDFRFLQLDTAIDDMVQNVVTVFSAPKIDPQTGRIGGFFPEEIESDAQARDLIDKVLRDYPQAASLIAPDRNTALMLVTLDAGFMDGGNDDAGYKRYRELRAIIADAAPDDFRILYTGLTPIGTTVVSALISDQFRLTTIGLTLGIVIALLIYRSMAAALICSVPPALTALWSLGLFGAMGTPVNYLSTVLPTLALILAFADGIVVYYRWQNANALSDDLQENLADAIRRVGPASALTSVTTLLAFLSFSFAPGSALKSFSLVGMCVVTLAFMAVIVGLPVAAHWALKLGLVRPGKVRKPAFQGMGERFVGFVTPRPGKIALFAVLAVIALSIVHSQVRPEYRITDYLPEDAETREAELLANRIGGRAQIFLSVPAARPDAPFAAENLARLDEVESIARTQYEPVRIFSLRTLTRGIRDQAVLDGLAREFSRAADSDRNSYRSRDGERLLVSVRISSEQSIEDTLRQVEKLRGQIDSLDYGSDVVVTGFEVLMAEEFSNLIDQLRTSLLIAIFLGVAIIGVATRSLTMAVVALTPNLLPIFSVELIVWLKGGVINISEVIALTIAFGIAIDNAVHVVNVYRSERNDGKQPEDAITAAMVEVGPALAASTVIICTAALVTHASVLPMVPVLGKLMIATLLVAFFSNMAILPANILTLKRALLRWRQGIES
ncbi:MAG: MMPL family transporter, partial [Pseudomonadota bacterium]|nr:MMPL family transporter [Pseudomonadota bacterium]